MRRDMFRQLLERGGPELKEKLEQSEAEAMEKAKDKGIYFFQSISPVMFLTTTNKTFFAQTRLFYSRSGFPRGSPRVGIYQEL